MIFIIPLILGAAAIAASALGIGKGVAGVSDMNDAKKIGESAQERHESACNRLKNKGERTQALAEEYGQLQLDIKIRTIGRFVNFLERIGQRGSHDKLFLEGLEGISIQQINEYKAAALEAKQFVKGGFKAAVAGAGAALAAKGGALGMIGLFGTASTGTAISGLSGAAAWHATLAWLGGGSLVAGGGGMAVGTLVLGGIMVGPALAVGGFMLAGEGEKALTKAREYDAKVNIEITKIDASKNFLKRVQRQIDEIHGVVDNLNSHAISGLNQLESQSFDLNRDADVRKLQKVALLVQSLAEIMKTPVLDSEGNLNSATAKIKAKYGTI